MIQLDLNLFYDTCNTVNEQNQTIKQSNTKSLSLIDLSNLIR